LDALPALIVDGNQSATQQLTGTKSGIRAFAALPGWKTGQLSGMIKPKTF
jgi:hypothetical protein